MLTGDVHAPKGPSSIAQVRVTPGSAAVTVTLSESPSIVPERSEPPPDEVKPETEGVRYGLAGAVASTDQEAVTTSLSVPSLTAFTARLCGPSASGPKDFGDEHAP